MESTLTAPIKTSDLQDKGREMIFELINRSNSQWVKRGTEHSANPKHLNSPREYTFPLRSRKYLGQGRGYTPIQYVIGADTVFIEDQKDDKGKIIQAGLKSQGYDLKVELERSMAIGIKFLFGVLKLKKYGEDPLLLEFINNHEDNIESPAFTEKGGRDPRKLQMFNFKPLRKEVKAKKALETFDDDVKAMVFVQKLRTEEGGSFRYNMEVLNALCNIFEIPQASQTGNPHQKMEAIVALAKRNGAGFIKAIDEVMSEYRISIGNAIKYEVLQVTSKEARLKNGEQVDVIKKIDAKNQEGGIEELMYFFIGDEKGRQNYSLMCGETELKKAQSLN